jgi:nicotinamidase-related amidase
MKKILVIIDMQVRFSASEKPETRAAIIGLINKARKKYWPIMLVEYDNPGDYSDEEQQTWPDILAALVDYDDCAFVTKHDDDGSCEVIKARDTYWPEINNFVLCGVNTDACVKGTARGLDDRCADLIEIISPACNSVTEAPAIFWPGIVGKNIVRREAA